MAPPKNPNLYTYHLCFFLLVSTTAALSSSSYSSACPSLKPASDRHTEPDDVLSLTRSFQISNGHLSGGAGAETLFSPDDDLYGLYRSFSLFPHGASLTNDQDLVHLAATLTLTGPRTYQRDGRRHNYTVTRSISFVLDGYYSSASLQLCMVGAGTEQGADGSLKHYPGVSLRLRIPSPPKLTDPFVTGTLEGSDDLSTIHLLAYAEGEDYSYGSERATCGSGTTPTQMQARGSFQALGGISSAWCAHLKSQLVTSYRLQEHGVPWMDINQMQCAADGSVRAYVVFSNGTVPRTRGDPRGRFQVEEEAVVAEGRWDQVRGVLCLIACRVVRERSAYALVVREHECGIGMKFWFPAVWTIRDRSLVAGMLWNLTQTGNADAAALITASSIDHTDHYFDRDHRSSNLSDVKYMYNNTMLEEARKHYNLMKFNKEKIKGSFPGNHTYRDLEFQFYGDSITTGVGSPVTLGSAMVYGDRLAADHTFAQSQLHARAVEHGRLLSVSYDIQYSPLHRPANGSSYTYSYSSADPKARISAEGVYDPETGILCMVGCQDYNGSTDCQILVTVKFPSLNARGHGRGLISSLRDKTTDSLFFDKMDITLFRMYSNQASEAISRMDLESIMLVASTTLSCVFTILQILHIKKNPEAARATSITMLAILTIGYLTPLVLNFEAMFISRRSRYFENPMGGSLEMNEVMLRAPILIAFVLQLRLLQLAWSGRTSSPVGAVVASERIVLQICLPLYLLGGVVAAIFHLVRAATEYQLAVRVTGEPVTLWADLVSYAGLILDGFLLPQVILNASSSFARSGVPVAISSWFYIGGTTIRAMPHVYDVVRGQIYEQSISPSDVYANPRGDIFGVAWDIVIPCGAALLAVLLFLQQRLGRAAATLPSQRRRSDGYELVSN